MTLRLCTLLVLLLAVALQQATAFRPLRLATGGSGLVQRGAALVRGGGGSSAALSRSRLAAVPATSEEKDGEFDLKAWFDPNTRGGVIVWCVLLLAAPIGAYNYFVSTGIEDTKVGGYVGAIFVLLSNLLWASTYIFRVANKDMTYAKQLRDYENAVLAKRLEELADDEIDALMQEIEEEEPTRKD